MTTLTPTAAMTKDMAGKIRHLEHIEQPFMSPTLGEPTPEQLADEYVASLAGIYQLDPDWVTDLAAPMTDKATTAGGQIHRTEVKDIAGSVVVDYGQTYRGLPVWGADFAVHIAREPMRVTSSSSTLHDAIELGNDPKKVAAGFRSRLTPAAISQALGLDEERGVTKINDLRPVIFEYLPAERIEQPEDVGASFEQALPLPPLPPVPETFVAGEHYAVIETLFDLAGPEWEHIHWRAMIEPLTNTVLYLRALVAFATGSVFRMDPISLSGDATLTPHAPEASLNPWRTTQPLTDLSVHTPQDLGGPQVDVREIEAPTMAEPTTTAPFDFSYTTKTPNFAAVNAYYHVNWFFNLLKGMGLNLGTYFDHTTFPVPVDHWSFNLAPNAHCPGNAAGNGIGHFCFGVAEAGQTVGIADDVRVVIHEFGHALLWDHVNSPNFGFAHSAGDALAAILMDPASKAPDRGLTFPWPRIGGTPLDRRHDRKVADGWAWFGPHWNTQYGGEQVLSSTLFRLYQAAGGDSPYPADRAWASRYVSYLIIKAIGTLTTTTPYPEVFATALMNADLTTTNFEGQPGGALHKVIRWAFEKQGLYQPNAVPGTTMPPTTAGNPPAVDVYIDDGRHGEYGYQAVFWESPDMWVRRAPDGGTTHQEPIVGQPAYMYVRVKNRGLQAANNVIVKAYHCNPGTGLAWPDHWSPMDTPQLAAPGPVAPAGNTVLGPFVWTPTTYGHECLLAIAGATGDPGNDTVVTGPIAHSRFVPFDNNIGQRNIHPVPALNLKAIFKYLQKQPIVVTNPFPKAVQVEVVPVLPAYLKQANCRIFFNSAGGSKFRLGPYANQTVVFSAVTTGIIQPQPGREPIEPAIPPIRPPIPPVITKPGIAPLETLIENDGEFTPEEFVARGLPIKLRMITLIDGQNMGGITYVLEPLMLEPIHNGATPTMETEKEKEPPAAQGVVEQISDVLRAQPGVKGVRVRGVTLHIEFEP